MSRSWVSSRGGFAGRDDGRHGQVEPTAALVAVFAVSVGVSLYAGVLLEARPSEVERDVAPTAVDVVHERTSTAGVVDPGALDRAPTAAPEGYRLNATLRVGNRRWHVGPTTPADGDGSDDADTVGDGNANPADANTRTDVATRSVSVRLEPGSVRPGRLTVVVWQ